MKFGSAALRNEEEASVHRLVDWIQAVAGENHIVQFNRAKAVMFGEKRAEPIQPEYGFKNQ